MGYKGAVAAGHPETARAAADVLEDGGNAFDAVLAALCTAAVAEPVLCSLGGGGFLLTRAAEGRAPLLYDFFAHTPKARRAQAEVDFYPILADFGTQQQEFHIGMGSIATPGVVRGLFEAHRDLCTMPLARIVEPAVELAKRGVTLNKLQAYIFSVVEPIYVATESCRALFASPDEPDRLMGEGETFRNPDYADALETLAIEGEDLFHRGEMGRPLVEACAYEGGYLTAADLEGYRVERRAPLELGFDDARIFINPPPSTGGILIAFALELLRGGRLGRDGFGSVSHLEGLATAMRLTNRARIESRLHETGNGEDLLHPGFLESYRREVLGRAQAKRGTTHISVIDAKGNAASLTLSNGEGSGYVLPGTGIVINNMLGEEDINPHGFHRWPVDSRMASMMAPTLMQQGRRRLAAIGSGGSNRIRTAILQVLLGLLEFGMEPETAVGSPRMHVEGDLLSLEPGFPEEAVEALRRAFGDVKVWDERNLFFGGVHTVVFDDERGDFDGAGDPRRGGVALVV